MKTKTELFNKIQNFLPHDEEINRPYLISLVENCSNQRDLLKAESIINVLCGIEEEGDLL